MTSMTPSNASDGLSDWEIVRRVRSGDTDRFAELVERHEARIFSTAAKFVPADAVPEVAHEAFVQAFRSLPGYRPERPFGHWLARIAIRRCHDYWRARYRNREEPVSQIKDRDREWLESAAPFGKDSVEGGTRPSHGLGSDSTSDMRELLDRLLSNLSADDRMVLSLVYFEEMSVKEAADVLDWSVSKVKVRTHRARKRMKQLLRDWTSVKEL